MNMFLSGPMRKIANMGRMGDTELAHVKRMNLTSVRGKKPGYVGTTPHEGRQWIFKETRYVVLNAESDDVCSILDL